MNLDLVRLHADMHTCESNLREQKRAVRATPTPTREAYRTLRDLKAHATLLYAIRARSRGRLHLTKVTRSHAHLCLPEMPVFTADDQTRFIADRWRSYELEAA